MIITVNWRGVLGLIAAVTFLTSCNSAQQTGTPRRAPAPPTNVKLQIVDHAIHLSWNASEGAHHYTVMWGTDPGEFRDLADFPSNTAIITNPKRGEKYHFAVTAWNGSGESACSREAAIIFDDRPDRADRYVSKGNDLMNQGRYDEAELYFSTAIRVDPENPEAYQSRAQLYENSKKPDLAKKDQAMAGQMMKKRPVSAKPSQSAGLIRTTQ
ncbi:MAG: tetratricopeptide repeat protein [Thermodesulfobacteriota bacterium]